MMRVQRRQRARAAGVTICAEVCKAIAAVAAAVHVLDLLGGLIADDSAERWRGCISQKKLKECFEFINRISVN